MQVTTDKYQVRGYGVEYYCKITKMVIRDQTMITVSFGGSHTFCFIAVMDSTKQFIPYIDRVEYEEGCVKDGVLEEYGGTVALVKCALWTILHLFPDIPRFTLTDDSHINCKRGIRRHKMNLAYDYISKRNQTWYEHRFGATLPPILMENYKHSLHVLDLPLKPYEFIIIVIPILNKYKSEYTSSNTPREFINTLRSIYKDSYCFEVSDWLSGYMEYLGIKYYKNDWFINASDVKKPDDYAIHNTDIPMRGGIAPRKSRKNRNTGKKSGHGCVGVYGIFE